MAKVEIIVNGRSFQIGCQDGEEAHLRRLAAYFDSHVARLADQVGQIGDLRLFLMAALVVCDELAEAEKRDDSEQAARLLTRAAERIEAMAQRTESLS